MALILLVQGNTKPRINFTIKDPDGNPINLTGATIKLYVRKIGASVTKLQVSCSIDEAINGTCFYNWQANDLNQDGSYHAELEITFSDGSVQTTNLMGIQIRPALPS